MNWSNPALQARSSLRALCEAGLAVQKLRVEGSATGVHLHNLHHLHLLHLLHLHHLQLHHLHLLHLLHLHLH